MLEICFYTLAAGAIIYVIGQIWPAAQRRLPPQWVLAGLVTGFLLALSSDLVITYAADDRQPANSTRRVSRSRGTG